MLLLVGCCFFFFVLREKKDNVTTRQRIDDSLRTQQFILFLCFLFCPDSAHSPSTPVLSTHTHTRTHTHTHTHTRTHKHTHTRTRTGECGGAEVIRAHARLILQTEERVQCCLELVVEGKERNATPKLVALQQPAPITTTRQRRRTERKKKGGGRGDG